MFLFSILINECIKVPRTEGCHRHRPGVQASFFAGGGWVDHSELVNPACARGFVCWTCPLEPPRNAVTCGGAAGNLLAYREAFVKPSECLGSYRERVQLMNEGPCIELTLLLGYMALNARDRA